MTDRPTENREELDDLLDNHLDGLDAERRKLVRQLAAASAFAVPLTLAASLDGSAIRGALAQGASTSTSTPTGTSTASSTTSISTPATLALLGTGLAVLAYMRKRGLDKKNAGDDGND